MSVTLAQLRARARERADMTTSLFISDATFNTWVNESIARLHEKMVDAMGEEYVENQVALNTIAGTSDYALPADFFKLYGVEMTVNGLIRTLKPFVRGVRNSLNNALPAWYSYPRYMIVGSNIRILPSVTALSGKMYYAPTAPVLVADGDTLSVPNGWERSVVVETAIQALMKEESDTSQLRQEMSRMDAELAKTKDDRDLQFPKAAVDMDEINLDWRW